MSQTKDPQTKETIKGAILIYSCHKHKNTRLKEFGLKGKEYAGWKVFYLLGNPNIKSENIVVGNTVLLQCEDSYIHVGKKVVMGLKYVLDNYAVEEGILRGDDLVFNEQNLVKFLNASGKADYMGYTPSKLTTLSVKQDFFMPQYYLSHPEDFQNPLHKIPYTIEDIMGFNIIPNCKAAGGVVVYLSKRSCNILIDHFTSIDWNVFTKNDKYGYPYIIEDVAVGYILFINNIFLTQYPLYVDNRHIDNGVSVAVHTNKYK
jgi:hypothetical protein